MKKLILISMFTLLFGMVSATAININSLTYSNLNTGDKIIAEITVTNPNVFQDLRDVTLTWSQQNNPNAWTECNSIWNSINQTSWKWNCILTVTPQMNTSSNVYVNAITNSGNNSNILLGNFAFKGAAFPTPTTKYGPVKCVSTQICGKTMNKVCIKYTTRTTCSNR